MKLNFQINKYYILALIAKCYVNSDNRVLRIRKALHDNNSLNFRIASGGIPHLLLGGNGELSKITGKSILKSFNEILKKNETKQIIKETEEYLEQTQKQWLKNYSVSKLEMEKIIKMKIPNEAINVLIVHPELQSGRSFPQYKTLVWGHKEDWQNYSTVYLWHEILHWITYEKYINPDVMHALTELATDNELRIRLNKKGSYFHEGKLCIGHPHLKSLEKKILPEFKKYLRDPKMNIMDLEKKLIKTLPKKIVGKNETQLTRWSNWN